MTRRTLSTLLWMTVLAAPFLGIGCKSAADGGSNTTTTTSTTTGECQETSTACDADEDGVLDYEDNCPNEAGPPENAGCPFNTTSSTTSSGTGGSGQGGAGGAGGAGGQGGTGGASCAAKDEPCGPELPCCEGLSCADATLKCVSGA